MFTKLECNDFTFKIPTDITPGFYKLLVRFNNVFNIESSVLEYHVVKIIKIHVDMVNVNQMVQDVNVI